MISTFAVLAMILVACSNGSSTPETTATTQMETTTTTEATTTTTTLPPTTTTTPPTTTTTSPPTTTTTVPQKSPCQLLLETEKELKGRAQERTDCLDYNKEQFNEVFLPVAGILVSQLFYEKPDSPPDTLPELSDAPAVVHLLILDVSRKDAAKTFDTALRGLVAISYAFAEKLGIEEIHIRVFYKDLPNVDFDTYLDIYVTVETLDKLGKDATRQEFFNSLTVVSVVDGEVQEAPQENISEQETEK